MMVEGGYADAGGGGVRLDLIRPFEPDLWRSCCGLWGCNPSVLRVLGGAMGGGRWIRGLGGLAIGSDAVRLRSFLTIPVGS